MKLRFQVDIEAGKTAVWDAFEAAGNKVRWQQNFLGYRVKSGRPGQPGAVAELVFDEGDRQVTLTETITERRAPDFLAATYESPQVGTLIVHHFDALDDGRTRWSSWCNFRFRGLMRVMALFAVGRIRRRMEDDMQRFKRMVETDLAGEGA